ncbi:MarR family transcriptional regulator [Chryseolinea serpens]|uniref:MarR family transcriptional regulator n=1 Tax=Chryseolinea serpens TaxID=947013 RepID=UPI0015C15815|nr:MarR family transcriptional regulator [Chryseolinea serpens]
MDKIPVIVIEDISAITRRRLIQKTINFIVPGKQLFLPTLLLLATDQLRKEKKPTKALLPSAQVILLYRILKRHEGFDNLPMKKIAARLKYTGAAISKAADNLRQHNLCELKGTKEKFIHFPQPVPELWHHALPLLTNPVIKKVYVDILPKNVVLMKSNTSALPEYSEVSESKQQFRAIERNTYYDLEKKGALLNANPYEGDYCLEVWKYDPTILVGDATENTYVYPLSLFLSLKDRRDERIEQALEKIITDHIW